MLGEVAQQIAHMKSKGIAFELRLDILYILTCF